MTAATPTITEALVAALAARGVKRIFGIPGGGSSLDLIEAASARGLDFVLTRTENAATLMAAATAESAAAGTFPLAPDRLAYPEVLGRGSDDALEPFLYAGGSDDLADSLTRLAELLAGDDLWQGRPLRGRQAVVRFNWQTTAKELDQAAADHEHCKVD